jgi:hypothetical protein
LSAPNSNRESGFRDGQPPLCEQLKVRDIVDDLLVQVNGSFVAGYAVSGINSYYASDEERNRTKLSLEALVRSLPERSMRMQARFEITEGTGDLITRYNRERKNSSRVLQALDREHLDSWLKKDEDGFYLAFTSAFKELEPIPQFKATAKLGEFLEARFSGSF